MKSLLEQVINELKINSVSTGKRLELKYFPKNKTELEKAIEQEIEIQGNNADLNCIDVSKVKDMSFLFQKSDFNGDISLWEMGQVKDMSYMFDRSKFTGENSDLSRWNVSNVKDMTMLFTDSAFAGDITKWEVSAECKKDYMFANSPLEKHKPKWYKKRKTK